MLRPFYLVLENPSNLLMFLLTVNGCLLLARLICWLCPQLWMMELLASLTRWARTSQPHWSSRLRLEIFRSIKLLVLTLPLPASTTVTTPLTKSSLLPALVTISLLGTSPRLREVCSTSIPSRAWTSTLLTTNFSSTKKIECWSPCQKMSLSRLEARQQQTDNEMTEASFDQWKRK